LEQPIILIIYTSLYKQGGAQFKQVAETLATEKQDASNSVEIVEVNSKEEIRALFSQLSKLGKQIKELHFIGHSGMYGPMFGTEAYPEQFSPYELKGLKIPFAKNGNATFHACRTARWFAPYFAQVQKADTFGYHWYTTFSAKKNRFSHPSFSKKTGNQYVFGSPGLKSHGLLTSLKKRLGFVNPENLKKFSPTNEEADTSYDKVAELYANTFQNIKVRKDEFRWILTHFPKSNNVSMLDIGCGNGALLKEFAPKIAKGVGVDASANLLKHASSLNKGNAHIEFKKIDSPNLPFTDHSFDVITSLLSFRYLDWDLITEEINRVLKPNGKLIIVDMVTTPLRLSEIPLFIKGKINHYLDRKRHPVFYSNLQKLVTHKDWAQMLHYNPIRSQHEMISYLKSRYPNGTIKVINVGLHSRVVAFESNIN